MKNSMCTLFCYLSLSLFTHSEKLVFSLYQSAFTRDPPHPISYSPCSLALSQEMLSPSRSATFALSLSLILVVVFLLRSKCWWWIRAKVFDLTELSRDTNPS